MRNQLIQDEKTELYFRGHGAKAVPDRERQFADIYTPEEVDRITPGKQVRVSECTVSEYQAWIGRRGGKKRSDRKTRAVRKNGRKPKSPRKEVPA